MQPILVINDIPRHMVSSITSGFASTSSRRLTPALTVATSLLSTRISHVPIYGSPCSSVTGEAKDEDDYSDILTGVTDSDDVYAEQREAAAATERLMRSLKRFDSFNLTPKEIDGPSSTERVRTRSTATLEPIQEDEQLGCASFWGASEYVELLFDAEALLVSDEDIAPRSIFTPGSMPEPMTRLDARNNDKSLPTCKLLDTTHLGFWPALTVHEFCGHVPEILDFNLSPVVEKVTSDSMPRRRGRSLVYSNLPIVARDMSIQEPLQLEHDPVLRYATGRTVLPGLNHLRSVTARSATIQYDRDIEELFYATRSFLDDCHDGECTCLDGRRPSLHVPGENFLLADDDDDFGFSVERPTSQDIFESIDEFVTADMFNVHDDHGGISKQVLPFPGVHFDTTPPGVKASMVLGQLLYPSASDAVSPTCDNDNVSDVSSTDAESLSLVKYPGLTHVDADTHQCIAYTALQQLMNMKEDETRPVIHRGIPDEDGEPEVGLAELVHLYPMNGGRRTSLPPQNSPNLDRSSFDSNSGISPPLTQLQSDFNLQPAMRQHCEPYGLYSSNRSRHQRHVPQLRLATQLLPKRKPLYMIVEEERSRSSSSSSAESLDFAEHRGFVRPLEDRRIGFLDDDNDEGEDDSESSVTPTSTPDCIYQDLFTDAVWNTTPDLTFARTSEEPDEIIAPASSLPPPILEAFEIEIYSWLTFMLNCMNSERSDNEL